MKRETILLIILLALNCSVAKRSHRGKGCNHGHVKVFFANPLREDFWLSDKFAYVEVKRSGGKWERTVISYTLHDVCAGNKMVEYQLVFEANELTKTIKVPLINEVCETGGRDIVIFIKNDAEDDKAQITGSHAKIIRVKDGCGYYLRIAVFLDSSSSFQPWEFSLVKDFVLKLSSYFPLAVDKTSFALGQFASHATVTLGFDQPGSYAKKQFKNILRSMKYSGGNTRVDRAFEKARDLFKKMAKSSLYLRHQPTKVLLLVTDGQAPYDIPSYGPIQRELENNNVRIIALGTRHPQMSEDPDVKELVAIAAGKPENVFYMDRMLDLVQKIKQEGGKY